ncbi:MAG: fibronectin type III domain-containing protein, partial [Urechidicola sp.]|nr:fibronectin type III domain-containing protein [Urechidicola sp.]
PPSTIADLISNTTTETTTILTWTAATDNVAVTDYEVFQDVTGVGTPVSIGLTGGPNTMNVSSLVLGTSYDFTVYAKDAAGNTSLVSNTETVPTLDTTPPAAIDDLTSSNITYNTVDLTWSPVTDNVGVVDYRVYQDGSPIGLTGGLSSFSVSSLVELTVYQFKVTALDAAGNESVLSNVEIVETPKESTEINYTNLNSNLISVDWSSANLFAVGNVGIGAVPSATYKLEVNGKVYTKDLYADGNVGIGIDSNPTYKLAVGGNIIAEEVRVALIANWPDYVFEKNYELSSLTEVEAFINKYGHLKNIPSAFETELNGIGIGEMNALLLRKIEELTLYAIQQEKKINALDIENKQLQSLNERLLEVEKLLEKLKQ